MCDKSNLKTQLINAMLNSSRSIEKNMPFTERSFDSYNK